ncbi:flavin-binding monooxygenase-like family protein [Pseudomassariella vexata]|uniref:Flavin-binding monooxygenase-like family protein n=1 Tax=Pseudomassariella vexata TaxID=1141098 RepID=A0A1Y2EAI9_9PEZI|nr:flavin-binding monooxygenase-like family protein [Pseudomassariella vexata]ORY68266.1 flavin-binding monooxygenase-like family protein [Pseudomassariella vexata]
MPHAISDFEEHLDLAIIGAGWYGLTAAKTYLKLEPGAKLAIFDRDNTVGGTWSRDRIYPNLVAQVEHGYFNYPGTPMLKDGATEHNLVSGDMIFKYLDKFADDHGLKQHIRFNSWVSNVERNTHGGWKLTVNGNVITTAKLIVATGVTSIRNSPSFHVEKDAVPVIHSIDIAPNAPQFKKEEAKHFIIIGAAKSAYDAAVIRPNGSGPMPIMPAEIFGINTITMGSNRLMNYLSPSIMNTNSWLGAFFHRTLLGRWLTKAHWNFITSKADEAAGFGGKAGPVEGLRPDIRDAKQVQTVPLTRQYSCFWCDSSIGLITMDDFWSTLQRADITILRDNVDSVSASGATLRSGQTIPADYVIYCTGWGDHFSFFSSELKEELGIPPYGAAVPPNTSSAPRKVNDPWYDLDKAADDLVAKQIPLLAAGPKDLRTPDPNRVITKRRWRLYNRIVQSLWAVAYLLGDIELPTEDKMVQEVAQWNAWTRKRYRSVGERYPYALFDWIPYLDRLLSDLGVKTQRKAGRIADFLAPYGPHCYAGVVEEYEALRGEKGEKKPKTMSSMSSGSSLK